MTKKSLIITFIVSLLMVPLYIYTFNRGLGLFWVIFILDRIISPLIQSKFENSFDNLVLDFEDDESNGINKFLVSIIALIIIGLGMIIYVLFKSPLLFIVLILGEVMDNIAKKMVYQKSS